MKIILIFLILGLKVYALDITIVPHKKPILDKSVKEEKLSKGIIQPLKKPKNNNLSNKKIIKEIVKKELKKIEFLIPKSKPLIVKKENVKKQTKSKYYKQKDFNLAKKSIKLFEKGQWTKALSESKKASDKSIYMILLNGNIY